MIESSHNDDTIVLFCQSNDVLFEYGLALRSLCEEKFTAELSVIDAAELTFIRLETGTNGARPSQNRCS